MTDYPNPIVQLFDGNPVAIIALAGIVGVIVLVALLGLLWWKLPQPGKRMFLNNLMGGLPFVATAYDTKKVVFHCPRVFRGGVAYGMKGWHILPRLDPELDKTLNLGEQMALTNAFTIEGAQGVFQMEYAGKAQMVNPEIQYLIQHEAALQKMQTLYDAKPEDRMIRVPKQYFIDALNTMEDKDVIIAPVYETWRLNPPKIKGALNKAFSSSQLVELQNEIMQLLRNELSGFGNKGGILLIIAIIDLLLSAVIGLKVSGVF